jgi:hypothetical protein
MRRLIRLSIAAERLGVKPSTLRDWFLKRKHLDFVKAGRAVCVTEGLWSTSLTRIRFRTSKDVNHNPQCAV